MTKGMSRFFMEERMKTTAMSVIRMLVKREKPMVQKYSHLPPFRIFMRSAGLHPYVPDMNNVAWIHTFKT